MIVPLTDVNQTFLDGIATLEHNINAGWEPGFAATSRAMSSDMETTLNFRQEAGTCVILMTDEDSDYDLGTDKADAIAAMGVYGAHWYGIVDADNSQGNSLNVVEDYSMGSTSMAAMTGGNIWDIDLLDENTGGAILDAVLNACITEAIQPEVDFDVHPQSCPNPINIKSGGLTPMAILGSDSLNVNDIDPSTLKVNGFLIAKYAYEDVAAPYDGEQNEEASKYECWEFVATDAVPEYLGDGYMDLTFKIKTKDLELDKDVQYLEVTGEKYDGTPINGKDVVWVK